jgi:hypothetical protein
MSTRVRPLKAIAATVMLFGLLGCHTSERGWRAGGLKDDYTVECKHFFLARIYEDHWVDEGPNRYAPHRFKATVVRSFKGSWKPSERVAFVHYVDCPASTVTNAAAGSLIFITTNKHTAAEITLDAGEFGNCYPELLDALEKKYPEVGSQ